MIAATARCGILALATFLGLVCLAQAPASSGSGEGRNIISIQKVAVAALNFREGDAAGFNRAHADFTSEGWKDFLTHMQGFLGAKGAPTFTSSFIVKHAAMLLDEKNGVLHVKIPGSLTQSNKLGRTVYDHAAIEVYAFRDQSAGRIKIQKLEQITCRDASKSCD